MTGMKSSPTHIMANPRSVIAPSLSSTLPVREGYVPAHDEAGRRDAEDARTLLELVRDERFALDETAVAQREQHPVLLVEPEPLGWR